MQEEICNCQRLSHWLKVTNIDDFQHKKDMIDHKVAELQFCEY